MPIEIELPELPTLPLTPATPARAASPSRSSTFSLSRANSKHDVLDDERFHAPGLSASASRDSSPMRRFTAGSAGERASELGTAELHPVDRGRHAMLFVAAAFVLETTIWGYSFTFGIVQVYLHSHPPFDAYSLVSCPPPRAPCDGRGFERLELMLIWRDGFCRKPSLPSAPCPWHASTSCPFW